MLYLLLEKSLENRPDAIAIDKFLLIAPMNSLSALDFNILPAIRHGSIICYLPTNLPGNVYIKTILPILFEQNITYIVCISSTLRNLVEEIKSFIQGEYRKSSLRYCFIGGEKAGKCLDLCPLELYRMIETNGSCAIPADNPRKFGSYKPFGGTTKFRITNDNWEDVPCNTCGEITIYSNAIMTGYLSDEKTTQQIMKNGWL
ncbi:unnamed protein product [Didymodactylos carnosus]|uniref:AMP-dependent synthetase/ligase domain-containing protein n=1 Tax=Didymodactylos carnosus TaxID=1234261 RepID=A0A815W0A7_9BILA|nr:unnamed protein product [Didymodactylos carnosus]CAF1541739.1 unnamed protein product [Didymodactylos carnosus]CAF4233239.1 unnamed protein product [Didymodactylos carnosus]CAF4402119.1 unnamed protein product [Didymodactylos carnosus]